MSQNIIIFMPNVVFEVESKFISNLDKIKFSCLQFCLHKHIPHPTPLSLSLSFISHIIKNLIWYSNSLSTHRQLSIVICGYHGDQLFPWRQVPLDEVRVHVEADGGEPLA